MRHVAHRTLRCPRASLLPTRFRRRVVGGKSNPDSDYNASYSIVAFTSDNTGVAGTGLKKIKMKWARLKKYGLTHLQFDSAAVLANDIVYVVNSGSTPVVRFSEATASPPILASPGAPSSLPPTET